MTREATSRTRARINSYVTAAITAVAAAVFLNVVPFVPAAPYLPLVVAIVLGIVSLRESGMAFAALYLLAFFATLWQLIGFGYFHLMTTSAGLSILAVIVLPLFAFLSRRVDATSLSLAILAVGLMLTPEYFLSVPVIVVAATIGDFASAGVLSSTFVLLLSPFLLLENGLYLSSAANQGNLPIVFAPLTILASDLRPPLPNLNVLISEFPQGYFSSSANAVSGYLTRGASAMVIPLLILLVVLVGSTTIARLARPLMEKFHLLEKVRLWGSLTPLLVSVIASAIFAVLLAVLSLPGAGGFQTSLVQSAGTVSLLVIGGSVLLGGAFAGLDLFTARLERPEVSSTTLTDLITRFNIELKKAREAIEKASAAVPSMNLGTERKTLSESESHVRDIEMQLGTATSESAMGWIDRFNKVVHPAIQELPSRLTRGVIAEVNFLSSVSLTANNNLQEAQVEKRYPPIADLGPTSTMDEATKAYEDGASAIRKTTTELFDLYVSTGNAYSGLMGQEQLQPSVSPASLLDSHDYATAMRLVSGEYWLDFHIKRSEEFTEKVEAVTDNLLELRGTLGVRDQERVSSILQAKLKPAPAHAILVQEGIRELMALLAGALDDALREAEAIRRLVATIDPTAERIVKLETTEQVSDVAAMRKELDSVERSFSGFLGFMAAATPLFRARVESTRRDEGTLIMLSQYPLAARAMDSLFERRKRIKIDILPFQRKASGLYCKLYAAANPTVRYDELEEVLSVKDA